MPEREPTFQGTGKAWVMEVDAPPETNVTLGTYLLSGPWHPLWHWWMIACVHLRPVKGVAEPVLQYPEAEYELIIIPIDPEGTEPDPDKSLPQNLKYLTPPDLSYQFHGVTDAQAFQVTEHVARTCAAQGASPDSDYRQWWITALDKTVKHYREGVHT